MTEMEGVDRDELMGTGLGLACDRCGSRYLVREVDDEQLCEDCAHDDVLRTDGGTESSGRELPDDHSMRCYDCDRVVHRRHISYRPVHMEIDGGPDYERVDVPMCEECALRRSGLECPHCGEYHWDVEAIFECKRDNPRLLPDGGTEVSGRERIEAVRVYRDGSWKFKDDGGWIPLTDHEPRSPSGSLLKRLYSWAYLCVMGGDYSGVDRRRNRPAAYYSEVDADSLRADGGRNRRELHTASDRSGGSP